MLKQRTQFGAMKIAVQLSLMIAGKHFMLFIDKIASLDRSFVPPRRKKPPQHFGKVSEK
jgi:hypothetical protein